MGKPPAIIIIARHGARLDAADKSWHLTSPAPYDPPLTYGGWTQSKALGLRIASLVQAREDQTEGEGKHSTAENEPSQDKSRKKKKKHKIFIHSSPFQRCVQTSVGISAGISQYRGIVAGKARNNSRPTSSSSFSTSSPRLHAVDATAAEVAARSQLRRDLRERSRPTKTSLRVDAFLGEWLSPDYFDMITPPPNSTLMIAGAKSELVKRGDNIDSYSLSPNLGNRGPQGNLWSSNGKSPEPATAPHSSDGPLDMRSLSHTLPGRDRTSSYSSGRISPFGRPAIQRSVSSEKLAHVGYVPPAPSYAISPVEPIPRGYVAHARDACLDVDFHWDSMREPLLWGDGGEFGEEWSAMHKRFRRGFGELVDWYSVHGSSSLPDDHEAVPGVEEEHEEEDLEEEIVIVLVTHGAGCNALIGALTEQPVLIDVGMASMSMAVRKESGAIENGDRKFSSPQLPSPDMSPELNKTPKRSSSRATGFSRIYEMKMLASSDHLRPGVDPTRLSVAAPASPVMAAAKTVPESRRRSTMAAHASAGSSIDASWSITEYPRSNTSTALGSIRRLSVQNNVPQRSGSVSSIHSTTGLWMPSTPPLAESQEKSETPKKSSLSHEGGPDGRRQSAENTARSGSSDNNLGITFRPEIVVAAATPVKQAHFEDEDVDPLEEIAPPPTLPPTTDSPNKESQDQVSDLPRASSQIPSSLGRTLSQKGLWGSAPKGVTERERGPKRRWTLQQD